MMNYFAGTTREFFLWRGGFVGALQRLFLVFSLPFSGKIAGMISLKNLALLALALAVPVGSIFAAPVKYSQRETFDFGWKFAKFGKFSDCLASNDPGEAAAAPGYADGKWRKLDLPHDWGVESPFLASEPNQTGSLPWAAVGWYRKDFKVPASSKGNRFFLDFDGVMMTPKVYVNGKLAGEWAYGYSSFRVDITPFLKFGGNNVVAVRAENKQNSTRWYPGAGIYRHVWITESNPVHIANWGVFVRVPDIKGIKKIDDKKPQKEYKAASAKIVAGTTVANTSDKPVKVEVTHAVYPLVGKKDKPLVTGKSKPLDVPAGEEKTVDVDFILSSPKLWDVLSPSLYVLRTTVEVSGVMTDRKDTIFGVRKAEWRADGFYLNNRRVQIKGVCQHHDLGPLGGAVHKRAIERQIEILKSFGTNSIRTSHNPPAPELLELCDRMGILVNDELFDCWKYLKEGKANGYNLYWDAWRERDVRNFIMRDRNHPSVIIWSVGNEIEEQGAPDGPELAKDLVTRVKKYDTTRPVTLGSNDIRASRSNFGKQFDVFGFNYKPNDYSAFARANPKTPFFGSETSSCVSTRGFYSFPENDKDYEPFWKRNFCDNLAICQVSDYGLYAPGWAYAPDVEFAAVEDEPRCAGEYVWTGFDYLGEPTPWNLGRKPANDFRGASSEEIAHLEKEFSEVLKRGTPARSSYFGIVDLCGFWKDRTYLYQSHWMPDVPMAHILPHWNWKGKRDGKITPVFVYTSGDSAELFLNGKSLGKRKKKANASLTGKDVNGDLRERFRLTWMNVKYVPGTLKVVAYKNGKKWAEDTVKTTGDASDMRVSVDRDTILGDGRDLAYVTIEVTDKEGLKVPTADNRLKFTVSGNAEIVGVCNGSQTDHDSMKGDTIKAFSGMAQVILRSKRDSSGKATLKISGAKLPSKTIEIKIEKPSARQLKK